MSYNGSGTFNINTAGQPVVTGTVISSSVFNALTADLATGLSTAITKDGQTTITANIPMNSYKFTGLAAGTAATDSVRLGQVQAGSATVITVTGTDTYTGTMSPALSAYAAGQMFTFTVSGTNTTACTINIDGLGAKSITRDGSTALVAGDLVLNSQVIIVYDGTRFQVVNSNSKTNFNLSGTLTVAGNTTLSGGTANGVAYLNGSKVLTTGSALVFDGTNLGVGTTSPNSPAGATQTTLHISNSTAGTSPGIHLTNGDTGTTAGDGTLIFVGNAASTGTTSLNIYNQESSPICFFTGTSERMRLDSSGNLGIGTSSPGSKLEVAGQIAAKYANPDVQGLLVQATTGTNAAAMKFSNTGGNGYVGLDSSGGNRIGGGAYSLNIWHEAAYPIAFGTNNTLRMTLNSSGNLLVGTTNAAENAGSGMKVINTGGTVALVSTASDSSQQGFEMYSTTAGAYRLYINYAGTINATNTTISAISDQRLKENIQDIDVGLDAIMSLKPRKFDWKAGKGKDIKNDRGWIAQEFEQVFPDMIDEWRDPAPEGEEPYKSVRADLIPVLVKAIQELTARVAQLESK